jgi:hypothetical protein
MVDQDSTHSPITVGNDLRNDRVPELLWCEGVSDHQVGVLLWDRDHTPSSDVLGVRVSCHKWPDAVGSVGSGPSISHLGKRGNSSDSTRRKWRIGTSLPRWEVDH